MKKTPTSFCADGLARASTVGKLTSRKSYGLFICTFSRGNPDEVALAATDIQRGPAAVTPKADLDPTFREGQSFPKLPWPFSPATVRYKYFPCLPPRES